MDPTTSSVHSAVAEGRTSSVVALAKENRGAF